MQEEIVNLPQWDSNNARTLIPGSDADSEIIALLLNVELIN